MSDHTQSPLENRNLIPLDLKKRCVAAAEQGKTAREIFTEIFREEHPTTAYQTFRRRLSEWKKMKLCDDATLAAGTYEGFTAHDATVQVNKEGQVVQAWIKQALDDFQWESLLDAIHNAKDPVHIEPPVKAQEDSMLEIPLYDMHLPMSDHRRSVEQLISIILSKGWDEINIVVGQDMFHNDDMRGRTASGRQIEKVDVGKAWEMGREIWYSIIDVSLANASRVNLIYSYGNHDESLSWAFVQMLKDHYPQLYVDDRMKQRKCIYWRNCFIGITHGAYTKSSPNDFRGQFTIEYPMEFAMASVREIHAGHLHHEKEADLYGVMTRRLSRGGETDKWSEDEGFVGSHKRFMVFEWIPGALRAIHYI